MSWSVLEKTISYTEVLQAHGYQTGFVFFVCQSYCGVRFGSFTLLPDLPAFAFRDFFWYLEFFVLEIVYLCVVFIKESGAGDFPKMEDIASFSYWFWIVLFRCSYMKIAQQPVQLFWGCFHDFSFFGHTHLEISEIRSYRSRLFSSRCLPVVGS